MNDFFFDNDNDFIEAVRKLIPEEILVEPHFDFKIAPLCRQQYIEEAKLKKTLAQEIEVKRFIGDEFSYDFFFLSKNLNSSESLNVLLSEIPFKIQWYDNFQELAIFDFRKRHNFEYENIPKTQTKEGDIFNSFIYNRMKHIVEKFKRDLVDKVDYLIKLDFILGIIDKNDVFNLDDSFLIDKKRTKKEIHDTILYNLEIAFLMNDTTDEKTINMLKTKVSELPKEISNKPFAQVI